jgi:hypothetical protein
LKKYVKAFLQTHREEKDKEEARSPDDTKQLWRRSGVEKKHQWPPHLLRPNKIFSSPLSHGLIRILGSPPLPTLARVFCYLS